MSLKYCLTAILIMALVTYLGTHPFPLYPDLSGLHSLCGARGADFS